MFRTILDSNVMLPRDNISPQVFLQKRGINTYSNRFIFSYIIVFYLLFIPTTNIKNKMYSLIRINFLQMNSNRYGILIEILTFEKHTRKLTNVFQFIFQSHSNGHRNIQKKYQIHLTKYQFYSFFIIYFYMQKLQAGHQHHCITASQLWTMRCCTEKVQC